MIKQFEISVRNLDLTMTERVKIEIGACGSGIVLDGDRYRGHSISKHQLANGGCNFIKLVELKNSEKISK